MLDRFSFSISLSLLHFSLPPPPPDHFFFSFFGVVFTSWEILSSLSGVVMSRVVDFSSEEVGGTGVLAFFFFFFFFFFLDIIHFMVS